MFASRSARNRATSFDTIVGEGLRLALFGVAFGLVAAFALTRLLRSFLFGISAYDPLTFVGVSVLLTLVAVAATYFPARRATLVDPSSRCATNSETVDFALFSLLSAEKNRMSR